MLLDPVTRTLTIIVDWLGIQVDVSTVTCFDMVLVGFIFRYYFGHNMCHLYWLVLLSLLQLGGC
jgi:hypothetical protein